MTCMTMFNPLLKEKDSLRKLKFLIILFYLITGAVFADDPGIHKARLIQQNDSTYVFEVDVSQKWLWAIKAPIFPSRFKVSEQEYINRGSWFVARIVVTSSGQPLNSNDEILLPWSRNGADITAFWLDGTVYKGLFIRDFTGIMVPLKQLLPQQSNKMAVMYHHFLSGGKHLYFYLIYILFALALVLVFTPTKVFRTFLFFVSGQGISLFFAQWGVPGVSILFADLLGLLIVIYLVYMNLENKKPAQSIFWLLFFFGFILGLSYYQELEILDLSSNDKSIAQFVFLAALDIGILCLIILSCVLYKLQKNDRFTRFIKYGLGSLSFFVILILFSQYIPKGNLDVLQLQKSNFAKNTSLPFNEMTQKQGLSSAGKSELTTPAMSFLTIEPYEIRHEILINARTAIQLLGVKDEGMNSIPLSSLTAVKNQVSMALSKNSMIQIDGMAREPGIINSDFVTLSASGVLIRDEPVPENLDRGIIGVTMIYETPHLANNLSLRWDLLSPIIPAIETTAIDPFGSFNAILSEGSSTFDWNNVMISSPAPALKNIEVERRLIPYLSYLLLGVLVVLLIIRIKNHRNFDIIVFILLFAAVISFPFVRFHLNIPLLSQITPSPENTEKIVGKLLTNVYRSFDVRNENKVYDRLELSVTGEKLAEIYMANRKSLELENRGGARASIDKVLIDKIGTTKGSGKSTFTSYVEWTVHGSVVHFGHTHYRQNWYNAMITFTIVDNVWKIQDIDLIEEKRLL